jgi:hypothetical protein
MNRPCLKQFALALAAFGIANAAFGQYVWINEKGIKQYSDMPPPASVPQSRILKEPGRASRANQSAIVSSDTSEAKSDATAPDNVPHTLAEKNADFQKRRAEQAQKEKKTAEDEKLAAAKAKNCEQTRSYQRSLDSGERIARMDKNGEHSFLSDDERAREMQDTKRALENCK